jgi:hypothetical protein
MDIDNVMRTDLSLLPDRRRGARERWKRVHNRIDALLYMPRPPLGLIGALMAESEDLLRAVLYLGEPDLRLDLYRMCGVELPPASSANARPEDGRR